jgi:hypothetical protein
MTAEMLLFGGRLHRSSRARTEWSYCEAAVALRVHGDRVTDRIVYDGIPLVHEIGIDAGFKAASISGDFVYACTSVEVLKLELRTLRIVDRYTHPLLNDVHHVLRAGDHLFVASTGIDSVLELDEKFQLVQRYAVAGDQIIAKYGEQTDFRRIPSTKPHHAHPNFVAAWDDELWVTNFQSGRVQTLKSERYHPISPNRIHDGVPAHGKIWFTAVNGEVIELDPVTGHCDTFELVPMTNASRALGWCRGIGVPRPRDVLVAFTRLRETKIRENLKWLGNKLLNQNFVVSLPTHVARYDLARRTETWRFETEDHDLNTIFSVHLL